MSSRSDYGGAPLRAPIPPLELWIKRHLAHSGDPYDSAALNARARLVMTPDGRPIRSIITGRRTIVTGSYASRKAGRAFPYEGMNEPCFFMHCEVDTKVVDYRAQPFRFEFVRDGDKLIYIADCVRLLSDGSIEVVEVKNDRRALRDPHYAAKLALVGDSCAALGWTFRIVLKEQLISPAHVFANIDAVQARRMTSFGPKHVYLATNHLHRAGGQSELGTLADHLGCPRLGASITQAMMVRRIVEIDLSRPLSPQSPVHLVQEGALG